VDWSAGSYEETAATLEPVAEHVVDVAAPVAGEAVLDVACGTGNAALLAAARGARVTGVDLAPRLLEVAVRRAYEEGVTDATWLEGDAEDLPVGDDTFDVVLSVFGVIFAGDARAAGAELVRATRPGGRIVLSAWLPHGPVAEVIRLARVADDELQADRARRAPRMDWADVATLQDLLPGAEVHVSEHAAAFTAPSPRAWVDAQDEHHPSWLALRSALPADRYATLLEEATRSLAAGNEDPAAFLTHSPYVVVRADVP
jgi:SAM-dependent methyltransferase